MTLPVEQRFNVLAQAFVAPPHDAYLAQEYAGQLLTMLKPPCPLRLGESLRQVLPKWNRSVEQLPLYLVGEFGHEAVVLALDEIDETGAVDRELTAAMRYWQRGSPPPHREPG
jgi:hypothetical protein